MIELNRQKRMGSRLTPERIKQLEEPVLTAINREFSQRQIAEMLGEGLKLGDVQRIISSIIKKMAAQKQFVAAGDILRVAVALYPDFRNPQLKAALMLAREEYSRASRTD